MQYQLLDSGGQQKLERFGDVVLVRPCSQAVWEKQCADGEWDRADGVFTREPEGRWMGKVPREWVVEHGGVKFKLMPTGFGHVGMFPEHAQLWSWMGERVEKGDKVLNLFAYTGGATLVAAGRGAEVCHVDASKTSVAWARENAKLNGQEGARVRWIVDDVVKFLKREVKRGSRYRGIVLDPPTFGRGSRGEIFKIERDLGEILEGCFALLEGKGFLILSSHTPGYTPLVMKHLLGGKKGGCVEAGELWIAGGLELPSGTYARWYVD